MSAGAPTYRPEIVGHRGAAGLAPENTLPSFRRAVELGVEWVELDVHLTADGRAVVIHDDDVERTTTGVGLVSELTLAQVQALEVRATGEYSVPPGTRIPTLEEALAALGPRTRCLVELKRDEARGPELVRAAVAAVTAAGIAERVRLISFSEILLAEARAQAPHLPRGIISGRDLEWLFAVAGRLECAAIHPNLRLVEAGLPARCAAAGLRLNAWTANDTPTLRRLAELRVDEITTDFPDLARDLLAGRD